MYQFFVDDCQIGKEYVTITGSDVNHIKNVLRMRPGEKIRVSSSSRDMFCEIAELTDDFVQADILDEEAPDTELPLPPCMFASKSHWMKISPASMKRCIGFILRKASYSVRWSRKCAVMPSLYGYFVMSPCWFH